MSRTRFTYFASNYQPRLILQNLLTNESVRRMLDQLHSAGSAAREQLCSSQTDARFLRKLIQLNVVVPYTIHGNTRYRIKKLPPYYFSNCAA